MPSGAQENRARQIWPALGGSLLLLALMLAGLLLLAGGDTIAGGAPTRGASTVELIMVEDPGCPYCARWDEEVGVAYVASPEGRFAPLVRRRRNDPEVQKFGKIIYSPTFILVRDGVEVGRIVGYPGADFFWGLLEGLLREAGFKPKSEAS